MASEIRANTLKNRVGLGTVSYTDTGIIVSGIVTANSFKGDGSSLTGIDATSLKDSAGNVKIQAQASGAVFTGIHTFTTLVGNVTGNVTGNISGGTVAGSTGAFSGDVSITDKIVHTDDTNTAIRFPSDDTFTVETGGNERVRIDSSGRVLIGTTTEGAANADELTISYNNTGVGGGDQGRCGMTIRSGDNTSGVTQNGYIYFSDGTSGDNEYRGVVAYSHSDDSMYFSTAAAERLRITSDGQLLHTANKSSGYTARFVQANSSNPAWIEIDSPADNNLRPAYIQLQNAGTNKWGIGQVYQSTSSGAFHIAAGAQNQANSKLTITTAGSVGIGTNNPNVGNTAYPVCQVHGTSTNAYFKLTNTTTGVGSGDGVELSLSGSDAYLTNRESANIIFRTGGSNERLRITSDGYIYGVEGGRRNWFDNGSFDCIGGRRASTSMDYGNHHAYGWVTDRFQSRNSVQWSRSTNVPTGKGFSYSTQTNGAGGSLVQAVELPDYGDMGVFEPGSYWCVSVWSTGGWINSTTGFGYDLGSTGRTGVTRVHPTSGSSMATTGETAAGTSTGTFTRYYSVFQMPSSIQSTSTSIYFTMAASDASYSTGFQLERVPTSTSKPTPYEHVHPSVTTARCRRYCYQVVNSRLMNGYKRHDGNIFWDVQFPVPPTHMPSGSNQSATPYGITLHDGGHLSNFQSVLQNPGVNSVSISEFDYRSGRFLINGSTSYSSTHTTVPAWESQEYEIMHGHF